MTTIPGSRQRQPLVERRSKGHQDAHDSIVNVLLELKAHYEEGKCFAFINYRRNIGTKTTRVLWKMKNNSLMALRDWLSDGDNTSADLSNQRYLD